MIKTYSIPLKVVMSRILCRIATKHSVEACLPELRCRRGCRWRLQCDWWRCPRETEETGYGQTRNCHQAGIPLALTSREKHIDWLIYLFIHSFIHSFIHLFIYSFIHLFIYYSFIHLLIYLFIHLFIYLFIYSFIYLFIYLFIYSFILSFIYLFIYLFIST